MINKRNKFKQIIKKILSKFNLTVVALQKRIKKLKPKYSSVKEILKKEQVLKLHLGCGCNYIDGWVNIDNNSDGNIEKMDFHWDLRKPLPFADDSIDFIFNEHFLEHLTVEEGQKSLKDFLRVLKPNGVMRIAMPDLDYVISYYNNPKWKEENKEFLTKFGLDFIKTKAEFVNINFYMWGHRWLYDWEELERRLIEAGFSQIQKCEIFKSKYAELNNLESRNESTLIAEVTK